MPARPVRTSSDASSSSATRRSPASGARDCCGRSPSPATTPPAVVALARDAGFLVNPVTPDAVRLAPPLVVTTQQLDLFVDALPDLLDAATTREDPE